MSISQGDKLFVYYDANKLPAHGRYSFFGNDFGSVVGFSQYIEGYIRAAKVLYSEYSSCSKYKNDTLDTIVYPLCFNYRQIVELYIKYLFFKYADVDPAEKKAFVKDVSHKLNKAWGKTRPYIEKRLQKIGNPINIELLGDFINQIDVFDTSSYRMRYPIGKDLKSVHNGPVKLDVVGLHQKMMDLFDLFRKLDYEIEVVIMENACEDGFVEEIRTLYTEAKPDILAVIETLRCLAEKEKKRRVESCDPLEAVSRLSMINIARDTEELAFEHMVSELPRKHAAILALLTHAGDSIVSRRVRLATDAEELKKDFFKLLDLTLQECPDFISLDGCYPCNETCYALLEKSAEVPLKWLDASIPIMESVM